MDTTMTLSESETICYRILRKKKNGIKGQKTNSERPSQHRWWDSAPHQVPGLRSPEIDATAGQGSWGFGFDRIEQKKKKARSFYV